MLENVTSTSTSFWGMNDNAPGDIADKRAGIRGHQHDQDEADPHANAQPKMN